MPRAISSNYQKTGLLGGIDLIMKFRLRREIFIFYRHGQKSQDGPSALRRFSVSSGQIAGISATPISTLPTVSPSCILLRGMGIEKKPGGSLTLSGSRRHFALGS